MIYNKNSEQIKNDLLRLFTKDHLEICGVEPLTKKIIAAIPGYVSSPYYLNGPCVFYRIRINKDKDGHPIDFFTHTDQLWAPPSGAKKGRCNEQGNSLLYLSNHPITCLAEAHGLAQGDEVTLTIFDVPSSTKIDQVNFVGAEELFQNDNLLSNVMSGYILKRKANFQPEKLQLIDELIACEFKKPVSSGQDFHYNSSIAWSNLCFSLNKANCIVYPSACSGLKTSNWAFDPTYAKTIMKPTEIVKFRVDEMSSDKTKFKITYSDRAILRDFGVVPWQPMTPVTDKITHLRVFENPFLMQES